MSEIHEVSDFFSDKDWKKQKREQRIENKKKRDKKKEEYDKSRNSKRKNSLHEDEYLKHFRQ